LFSILMLKPDAESSIDEPAKKNNAWERGWEDVNVFVDGDE
jgi:hypothetical protein